MLRILEMLIHATDGLTWRGQGIVKGKPSVILQREGPLVGHTDVAKQDRDADLRTRKTKMIRDKDRDKTDISIDQKASESLGKIRSVRGGKIGNSMSNNMALQAGGIMLIAGARPNFMKIAPVKHALDGMGIPNMLIHTGQHYDADMSEVFFKDLNLSRPSISLGIGSGKHGEQTGRMLGILEQIMEETHPSMVVVVGDVNSTLAAALAAAKLNLPVAHVEAGLRSRDMTMPEEINRILVDRLSSLLFTPSLDADLNLLAEGIDKFRIHMVGNVMIDSLLRLLPRALELEIPARFQMTQGGYAVCTMHRPSNVDNQDRLEELLGIILQISTEIPVIFPIHPRTEKRIKDFGLDRMLDAPTQAGRIMLTQPMGYLEFLGTVAGSRLVLTDSGGIQEETTVLGIPCLTMRENTERPITVTMGTNIIVGVKRARILEGFQRAMEKHLVKPSPPSMADTAASASASTAPNPIPTTSSATLSQSPPLWDGRAGQRIAEYLVRYLETSMWGVGEKEVNHAYGR